MTEFARRWGRVWPSMKFQRSVIALSAVALGFGVAGCADDDDDDVIEETVPGDPDLDPGAGGGLPGDEGDEGTTG